MEKFRAIQRCEPPNFELINGNGVVERIQMHLDPFEIAEQDPFEIAEHQFDPDPKKKSRHTQECTNLSYTSN